MGSNITPEASANIDELLAKAEDKAEYKRELDRMRTKKAVPRLNFVIPPDILRGIKVAAALQDSTIKVVVIEILDEWLREHPELSSYSYGETGE